MELPFSLGILILLLFYIIFAKYWCLFADWIGELIGLKWLIRRILDKYTKKDLTKS